MVTLTDQELADVDALVKAGIYRSRSDLGRMGIQKLIRANRRRKVKVSQ
jgi:Arc/MetJ-type ribon-helix-helix transcriptional regulator